MRVPRRRCSGVLSNRHEDPLLICLTNVTGSARRVVSPARAIGPQGHLAGSFTARHPAGLGGKRGYHCDTQFFPSSVIV
jgi:hypothetical protein